MMPRSGLIPVLSIGWIVTIATVAASDVRHEGAAEVFHCAFDEPWDVNYDAWPDRWQRSTGPSYPHYVKIEIREAEGASVGRSLVMDLDGAGAGVTSPPIRVVPLFIYKLEVRLKAVELRESLVAVTMTFLDRNNNQLEVYRSDPIQSTDGWVKVHLGPLSLGSEKIDRAVVGLEVIAQGRGDLDGQVWLDDVWLARLPRMDVRTNNPFNVYENSDDVVVMCDLSGIRERNPEIRFQLLDAMGQPLNGEIGDSFRLDGRVIVEDAVSENSAVAADIVDGMGEKPAGYETATEWKPPIPGSGFYRVAVRMLSSEPTSGSTDQEREMYRREIWLAVVPRLPSPKRGEFGWSLSHADSPLSFEKLIKLLPNVGINRIKLPVWYDASNPYRGDQIIQFAELLSSANIDVVGVLDRPPAGSDLANRSEGLESIADLFALDPSLWHPSLDPVMTRLALRLRWWQLGGDYDDSISVLADPHRIVPFVRSQLFRFGQEVDLGIGWNWRGEILPTGQVPWEFELLSANPPLGSEELTERLSSPPRSSAQRWVLVEPPARSETTLVSQQEAIVERVRKLVERIVVAKQHGAESIICPKPFDDDRGLMRPDGTPGELLLPWRTASAMLSGAAYLGSLQLPEGSENRVFKREDGQVVMVIWNDVPTEEVLYLGQNVQLIDCWGRATTPSRQEHRQVIPAEKLPGYVLGLHEAITRWRLTMKFDQQTVPSIFRRAHENGLQLQNTFAQGVGGSVKIFIETRDEIWDSMEGDDEMHSSRFNSRWEVDPPDADFALAAHESLHLPIKFTLKGAPYGSQPVRIEFDVSADQQYKFSVYRSLNVGGDGIDIDVHTHVDQDGQLIVEQTMSNQGETLVDFNCYLFAQGFRPQRAQVYRLGPDINRKIYRYPDGESLIGTSLMLEAVEIDGARALKYYFRATPQQRTMDEATR